MGHKGRRGITADSGAFGVSSGKKKPVRTTPWQLLDMPVLAPSLGWGGEAPITVVPLSFLIAAWLELLHNLHHDHFGVLLKCRFLPSPKYTELELLGVEPGRLSFVSAPDDLDPACFESCTRGVPGNRFLASCSRAVLAWLSPNLGPCIYPPSPPARPPKAPLYETGLSCTIRVYPSAPQFCPS